MIIVRRIIRSSSLAKFAKALPSADSFSTSYYDPNNRNARRYQKAYDRKERRGVKLDQRRTYNTPDPPIKSNPFVEAEYREYQRNEAMKNAKPPNTKQIWDDVAEDMKNAKEKFSRSADDVKNSVKPDFTSKAKLNPRLLLAGLGVAGIAGVGGTIFMRRRRTKNGKVVVEQVRRGQ